MRFSDRTISMREREIGSNLASHATFMSLTEPIGSSWLDRVGKKPSSKRRPTHL